MRYHCATSALHPFPGAESTLADAPDLAKPCDGSVGQPHQKTLGRKSEPENVLAAATEAEMVRVTQSTRCR